ncbi:DnaB-like helicase C-terminal domain-containing protein [Streptomyces sp. NPDC001834]|uniref:DnaB-like helicase C-terminal domain-containing protein n=1 Tax=Streptomyces sp. NPDC001834 TaxID=3364616 RepID=UPI00367478F0
MSTILWPLALHVHPYPTLHIREYADKESQAEGANPGLPMPYADPQAMLGTVPGHLVVVGRPCMGKSVVLLELMRHLAVVHGQPAAFVSPEMARRQITNRLIAAEAHCRWRRSASGPPWPCPES